MADAAPGAPLHGRRILVVEDDYMMAQDLAAELQGAGAEVLGPVPDVQSALDLLDAGSVADGAILDINLGGDLVYSLAEALQDRRIPFVFATGYEGWSIPERYRSLPRLQKPLDLRRIAELLGA